MMSGAGGNGGAAMVTGFYWRTLPSLAKKRQNAMGVAVGDTMYVIGGLGPNALLTDVERLDSTQTAWTFATPLPNAQCCAAAAAIGGTIAVAGGYGADGHTPTNALLLFDIATEIWTSGPPMPTARANAMAAVWNGKLAVIGGGTQPGATQQTGVIEFYDPIAGTWSTSTLTVTPALLAWQWRIQIAFTS
jgi:N-acetylneuraminic acid mutarotase